jgi:hypothetical protein
MCGCDVNHSTPSDFRRKDSSDEVPEPVVICECLIPNELSNGISSTKRYSLRDYIEEAKQKGIKVIIDSKNDDIEPFENESEILTYNTDLCRQLFESSTALRTLCRSNSTTSTHSHCSIQTVYTSDDEYTDIGDDSETDVPKKTSLSKKSSEIEKSSFRSTSTSASTTSEELWYSALRELGLDTRSRDQILSKGISWGLDGRTYLAPVHKGRRLLETVKCKSVKTERSAWYALGRAIKRAVRMGGSRRNS